MRCTNRVVFPAGKLIVGGIVAEDGTVIAPGPAVPLGWEACAGRSRPRNWSPILGGIAMKAVKNLLVKLVRDEQGGEVLEYALIAGLIVVAAIAAISAVGNKVLARWTSLQNSV